MRNLIIGLAASCVAATSVSTAQAQRYMRDDGPSYSRTEYREYRRGDDRRWRDDDRGANRRGFCPPGQAKKPGRGSAFNC